MVDMDVVITLLLPAELLCNLWSYDFMTCYSLITATSYDIYIFYFIFVSKLTHAQHLSCEAYSVTQMKSLGNHNPVSILRRSLSGRHRPARVADGPMTARCKFT